MTSFSEEEWAATVAYVLKEHPEYVSATVRAIQAGILAALDRKADRLATVSMGLVEALRTKPGQVRRNREQIVKAIEASTVFPSVWSTEAIEKEQEE